MVEDFKHSKLIHSSGAQMELDVYIEDLKLAFEYQGIQHYSPQYWTGTDLATQQTMDGDKRAACKQVQYIRINNGASIILL